MFGKSPVSFDLLSLIEGLSQKKPPSDYFSASHLAFLFREKIARSQAIGKDGMRVGRFADELTRQVQALERKIQDGSFKYTCFKEKLILRGAAREPRQISIPTVRDRLVLRALCQALHEWVPDCVGLSPHTLVKKVADEVRSGVGARSFVRLDVKNFFPSVPHTRLTNELIRHDVDPLLRWLALAAVETPTGDPSCPNTRGIPQGLSISGALAAIFLLNFDQVELNRDQRYYRYVDDILLIRPTVAAAHEVKRISAALNRRGLRVHPLGTGGKTEVRAIEQGIDFLGYHICIDKISVRDTSYKRMFRNLLKVITEYRHQRDVARLVFRLNLKISGCLIDNKRRGWMMFFSQTENISQLSFLDVFVIRQLARVEFPKERMGAIKRFVKSRHEITFNLSNTSYIPNFDAYDQSPVSTKTRDHYDVGYRGNRSSIFSAID